MDALDDENIVFAQLTEFSLVLPFSGDKIKGGQFHPLTADEGIHIMVEKLRIDGFQALKVIIAVFIPRSILGS